MQSEDAILQLERKQATEPLCAGGLPATFLQQVRPACNPHCRCNHFSRICLLPDAASGSNDNAKS